MQIGNKVGNNLIDVVLDPVKEGMIDDRILSHYLAPEGSVSWSENLNNDDIGMLSSRLPLVRTPDANAPAGYVCGITSANINGNKLIYHEGTNLKYSNSFSGAPAVINNAMPNATFGRTNFDSLKGILLIATAGQVLKYWNGTTYANMATSLPAGSLISAGFAGRIWSSTAGGTEIYYSDELAPDVISTTGGTNYLTVKDGNGITGFAKAQQVLFVFTSNSIYRIQSTTSIDNSPISNVGAINQQCIVRAKDGFYFLHTTGVYKLSTDGSVQEISRKIAPIIERIDDYNLQFSVGWADDDHIYFNVGSKIYGTTHHTTFPYSGGIEYQPDRSYVLRYTISTQVWTINSYYDFAPTASSSARLGKLSVLGGYLISNTSTRQLVAFGVDSDDLEEVNYIGAGDRRLGGDPYQTPTNIPIFVEAITPWITFASEHHRKRVTGFSIASLNAAGINVYYQTNMQKNNEWTLVGSLKDTYISEFRNVQTTVFNKIRLRFAGKTMGQIVKIGRPVFLIVDDQGYQNS